MEIILNFIFPIVTAFLGYLLGVRLEKVKFQRDLDAKYLEEKREAISFALEWIDKLRIASTKAYGLCYAYCSREMEDREVIEKFPDDHWHLGDPSARLRVSLPGETYPRANAIRRGIDELKFICISSRNLSHCINKTGEIDSQIQELDQYLNSEYKKTFNK